MSTLAPLLALLSFTPGASAAPSRPAAPTAGSLLSTVPQDAYVLVHCSDVAALRGRLERNDWYRLLGSSHGAPVAEDLAYEIGRGTHSDVDELLGMARVLDGETVFFDTGPVAGFVTAPVAARAELARLMGEWLPAGDPSARRTLEVAGGGKVELAAWPDAIDGWNGRAGHFAAFLDHPAALALYSGDDYEAVLAAVTDGVRGLGTERRAPVVAAWLAAGGNRASGVELFVDFTPLVDEAEAALKEGVEGLLPDPSRLLGLEAGTWLHAEADPFPGTALDCRGRLHLPGDSLAAKLADTFQPLPHTLSSDLPRGAWALWALQWDMKVFYRHLRAAYEEAGLTEGLAAVDGGVQAAKGMTGIDPIADVLDQLSGLFAFYYVEPAAGAPDRFGGDEALSTLGLLVGLLDGDRFLEAFETLLGVGGLEEFVEEDQIAGADVFVTRESGSFDGGAAFLPHALVAAPTRRVLERAVRAQLGEADASLFDGSPMQAAIDEAAGACFLTCTELRPLKGLILRGHEGELQLPPLDDGEARDPFASSLVSTARRTADGFDFRVRTR